MRLIIYARSYMLTIVIIALGIFIGYSASIIVYMAFACLLLDTLITKKSPELAWYRAGVPFENPALQQLSRGQAARLHLVALFLSVSIPVVTQLISPNETVRLLSGAIALLIAGLAASYCGFRLVRPSEFTRENVDQLDAMPDLLGVIELARPHARRVLFAMARIGIGLIALLPFAALLNGLSSEGMTLPLVLIVLVLAVFFQLGFALLTQALFSLRWLGGVDEFDRRP